jgi:glucosamine-6-phosphate deaminase
MPGVADSDVVREIKGLIRKGEARATCRFVGLPEGRAHFLNMPFYETGLVKKRSIGKEDVKIIVDLLNEIQPHQIYAAGDF